MIQRRRTTQYNSIRRRVRCSKTQSGPPARWPLFSFSLACLSRTAHAVSGPLRAGLVPLRADTGTLFRLASCIACPKTHPRGQPLLTEAGYAQNATETAIPGVPLTDSATIRGVFWLVRFSFPGKRALRPRTSEPDNEPVSAIIRVGCSLVTLTGWTLWHTRTGGGCAPSHSELKQ